MVSVFYCCLSQFRSSQLFVVKIRFETRYNEEAKLKAAEEEKAKAEKEKEAAKSVSVSKPDGAESTRPLKTATSSAEQDLDVFLLGDLGDSDEGPGAFPVHCIDCLGNLLSFSQILLLSTEYFILCSISLLF